MFWEGKLQNLITELKRRNVFRAAAAYLVIGWVLTQIAGSIESALSLPDWLDTIVVVLLLLGFPIVLVFSWVYEITSHGIEKTENINPDTSIASNTAKKLNYITLGALLLVGAMLAYQNIYGVSNIAPEMENSEEASENNLSIAVLPFVNLSSDPEQDYFSDGISEELLNLLAKIQELHVTSRSSAFAFKGKDINIPEVANKLGVAHVLEGSVRKSGDKIRITAQLIEAKTDKHLWSETYDRGIEDIFAVQDEISAAIVNELIVKLGLEEETGQLTRSPETSTDAYTTFLLANHQLNNRGSIEGIQDAKKLFYKAIEQDPNYAPSYSNLAKIWLLEAVGYGDGTVTMDQAQLEANKLIDKGLELNPNLSEAYAAKGLSLRFEDKSTESIDVLNKALEINPSNSDARNWLSMSYRVLNQSKLELDTLLEGHKRDPLKESIATNLVKSLSRFGRFQEADEVLEKIKSLGAGSYGFSKGETMMMRGRYADAIDATMVGEAAQPGQETTLTMHVASELMAAMGEWEEAKRIEPWDGKYDEYNAQLDVTLRDQEEQVQKLRENPSRKIIPWVEYAYMWSLIGTNNFELAEEKATSLLETLNPDEQKEDFTQMALAIIEWKKGNIEKALEHMEGPENIVDQNLGVGDKKSVNYLTKAVAEFIRGNEASTFDLLKEGFENKAPMSFEGENVFAIYKALGWDERENYQGLLNNWEIHNRTELIKIFNKACNGSYSSVWQPLPKSCQKYAIS